MSEPRKVTWDTWVIGCFPVFVFGLVVFLLLGMASHALFGWPR